MLVIYLLFCWLHFVADFFYKSQDLNHNGKINYTEFLAATIEAFGNIEEDRISEAFDRIDADDDGYSKWFIRDNLWYERSHKKY